MMMTKAAVRYLDETCGNVKSQIPDQVLEDKLLPGDGPGSSESFFLPWCKTLRELSLTQCVQMCGVWVC